MVGGSALSIYFCHRKSEDLDFFTYSDDFNQEEIRKLVGEFKNSNILNESEEQIDVILDRVKVTFFNAKWDFLKPKQVFTLNIATLEQIAIMKTNVLFLRSKYRDYYDMYFLVKRLGLKRVYELSKDVVEGINFKLFSIALLYIDDIEDENIEHLEPIKHISKKEIRKYFEQELKKLKFQDVK